MDESKFEIRVTADCSGAELADLEGLGEHLIDVPGAGLQVKGVLHAPWYQKVKPEQRLVFLRTAIQDTMQRLIQELQTSLTENALLRGRELPSHH